MFVRIDDYPTGVKPVIDNHIVEFNKVLSLFEERELPYILGVVPTLIYPDDIEYLKSLKYCEVGLHGYDHNIHVWNGENRDEYVNLTRDEIEHKITHGLELLNDFNIRMFIPPFNRIPQKLIPHLVNNNLTDITTGVNYNGHPYGGPVDFMGLKAWTPKKIFYGRAWEINRYINKFTKDDHIGLHLTWEVEDMKSQENYWRLPILLDKLKTVIDDT